jgi:hypothetical protein
MTRFDHDVILSVLDQCSDAYTFPMLDNGYVYLAATRLSLFRSAEDWALVIEVFGFSPRAGLPDTHIHTFAGRLHDRDAPDRYRSREAYENYLANNPNNESRFAYPVAEGLWQDPDDQELIAADAHEITVRGSPRPIPTMGEYARYGIQLVEAPRVRVFELCRFLAEVVRNDILAAPAERRISVVPEMTQILQLEEWHHPNVVNADDRPSGSPTFQQLAQVLVTGDVNGYRPSLPPNTHWRNWPDGGSL